MSYKDNKSKNSHIAITSQSTKLWTTRQTLNRSNTTWTQDLNWPTDGLQVTLRR